MSLYCPLLTKTAIMPAEQEKYWKEPAPFSQSIRWRVNLELRGNALITGTKDGLECHYLMLKYALTLMMKTIVIIKWPAVDFCCLWLTPADTVKALTWGCRAVFRRTGHLRQRGSFPWSRTSLPEKVISHLLRVSTCCSFFASQLPE